MTETVRDCAALGNGVVSMDKGNGKGERRIEEVEEFHLFKVS